MPAACRRSAFWVVGALWLATAHPLVAQQARPSVLAIDTTVGLDETIDFDGNGQTGVIVDAVISAGLGRGFETIVWPIAQRLASGEWNKQIWMATLRYQRAGRIGFRVEGGLIPSPVGLATLALRSHLNPTIAQPSSLFSSLPALEVRGPRTNLLGAIYPFGAQATLSGARWDGRVAIIDTSPLRRRRIFAESNPPRFTNVVVGGGITPMVGFRIGASLTHGGWQRAGETPLVTEDRNATIFTAESELSFAYTKLSGEWVRDAIETSTGDRVASGWFVQGQQTLAPRWFVAGRIERISAPFVSPLLLFPPLVEQQRLVGSEEVLGFRLTPEITLRLGHRARRGFGRPTYDHQAAVSVVWWKRWM